MTTSGTDCSCREYEGQLSSRRSFLRNALAVAGGTVATSVFGETFRQTAYGATADGNVLVVLSLRGGADGLSLVVPHGDPGYARARPRIAVPTSPLLFKNSLFGLHPGFAPLSAMWKNGKVAAVHAVGLPQPNRSHFSAIEEIEDADLGSPARVGWINRLVGLDSIATPLQAVSVGTGVTPTSLYGPRGTLSIEEVDDIALAGSPKPELARARRRALDQVWSSADGPLGAGARSSLVTTATLADTVATAYTPANGARYPDSDLGRCLKDTARLVKAQVGVKVVTLDYGSWDMHEHLGTLSSTGGASMNGMVKNLAASLAAFFTDLGATGSRVTLVTLTEFGRRLSENGSAGVDHGWANATLVMGAGVRGGYHGRWPGLDGAALNDGDLAVTTDYRSVLSEILSSRFNVTSSTVFPDFRPGAVGVMA